MSTDDSAMHLVDNAYTDKGSKHSYLPLYERLLAPIRESATNVLEVGIGDLGCGRSRQWSGGSILMWTDYFKKARVHGVDILPEDVVLPQVRKSPSVKLFCGVDAYDPKFVADNLSSVKYDFLLDDGPHTLESQLAFLDLYLPLLSDKGVLLVEDVPSLDAARALVERTPEHLRSYTRVYDLRNKKGRFDDIVFAVDRVPR